MYKSRQHYKNGKLGNDRFKCLDDIGFVWDPNELFWEQRFVALKEYKESFGNCNVPVDWSDQQLVNWTRTQRTNYRKGHLSDDNIKQLEDVGFVWHVDKSVRNRKQWEKKWEKMFESLNEYKNKHGDCNVPSDWQENMKLTNWVRTQRNNYRNNQLSDDYIKRLEDIGFVFLCKPPKLSWEKMFESLNEYKNKHGDCNVPSGWEDNKKLAEWVRIQRNNYRNKQLGDDRIKRLEEIGFEWNLHKR